MADDITIETEVTVSFLLRGDLPLLCPLGARAADDRRTVPGGVILLVTPFPRQVE